MSTWESSPARPRLLCVHSKAADAVLHEVLRHFDATSVADMGLAVHKASLGAYDAVLTYDTPGARTAVMLWRHMRRGDANTPIVIVCAEYLPAEALAQTKPGFDIVVRYPCDASSLLRAIRGLLTAAERRNMLAYSEEVKAISEEIRGRLALLEQRVNLSRQSLARAQEHVVRAVALRTFCASGGTRSHFENIWPDVFESALASSYSEAERQQQHSPLTHPLSGPPMQ